jgi:hypothetical protein
MPVQKTKTKKKSNGTRIRVVKNTTATRIAPKRAKKASAKSLSVAVSRETPRRAAVRRAESQPAPKDRKAERKTKREKQKKRKAAPVIKAGRETLEWSDLIDAENSMLFSSEEAPSFLGAISTLKFALGVLAIAGVFTLYVGHVYATQNALSDLQAARKENLSLRLEYNRTKGLYDAATGPAVIYRRAHALGLAEHTNTGTPIRVTQE